MVSRGGFRERVNLGSYEEHLPMKLCPFWSKGYSLGQHREYLHLLKIIISTYYELHIESIIVKSSQNFIQDPL